MADAQITLKLTAAEFDLLRDGIDTAIRHERMNHTLASDAKAKTKCRQREAQFAQLLNRLK